MNKQFSQVKLVAYLIVILSLLFTNGYAQTTVASKMDIVKDSAVMDWMKDLYEPGVTLSADSLSINKETQRLLTDKDYRATVYPLNYTWEAAIDFIKKQELKKAFWFFINLYLVNDQNKELVVKSILVYDKIFKMDKVLVSSFYTYCLTDPEIGKIEEGHSEITAPHIMEKKLNAVKGMLFYLDKYKPVNRKDSTGS